MEIKIDFEPKCDACKAACRIEGWSKCWDLCTCDCHKVKSAEDVEPNNQQSKR